MPASLNNPLFAFGQTLYLIDSPFPAASERPLRFVVDKVEDGFIVGTLFSVIACSKKGNGGSIEKIRKFTHRIPVSEFGKTVFSTEDEAIDYRDNAWKNPVVSPADSGKDSFLEKVSFEYGANFVPSNPISSERIQSLKTQYLNQNVQAEEESAFAAKNCNGDYFGRLDAVTNLRGLTEASQTLFYERMYLSKKPLGEQVTTLNRREIPWKYYAGILEISAGPVFGTQMIQPVVYTESSQVVDWRSPIAELYYEDELQEDININLANFQNFVPPNANFIMSAEEQRPFALGIVYQHHKFLKREFPEGRPFVNRFIVTNQQNGESGSKANLSAALERNKNSQDVNDIITSIEPDQDKIIRLPPDTNFVLQGCAGSGKTAIIFHRISYYIYNFPNLIDDSVSLTPNADLKTSLVPMFKTLGINSDKMVFTLPEYYEYVLRQYANNAEFSFDDDGLFNYDDCFARWEYCFGHFRYVLSQRIGQNPNYQSLVIKPEGLDKDPLLVHVFETLIAYVKANVNQAVLCSQAKRIKIQALEDFRDDLIPLIFLLSKKKTEIQQEIDCYDFLPDPYPSARLYDPQRKSSSEGTKYISTISELSGRVLNISALLNLALSAVHYSESNYLQPYSDLLQLFARIGALSSEGDGNPSDRLFYGKYALIKKESPDKPLNPYRSAEITSEVKKLVFYKKRKDTPYRYYQKLSATFEAPRKDFETLFEQDPNGILDKAEKWIQFGKEDLEPYLGGNYPFSLFFGGLTETAKGSRTVYTAENDIVPYKTSRLANVYFAFRYFGFLPHKPKYFFIDEAQETPFVDLKMLDFLANGEGVFELFGDLSQRLTNSGVFEWDGLKKLGKNYQIFSINNNYRNTRQICNFINGILHSQMIAAGPEGENIKTVEASNFKDEFSRLKNLGSRIAFIGKNIDYLRSLARGCDFGETRVSFVTPIEAKGMEYNTIFVSLDGMTESERYVALSRALSELFIIKT